MKLLKLIVLLSFCVYLSIATKCYNDKKTHAICGFKYYEISSGKGWVEKAGNRAGVRFRCKTSRCCITGHNSAQACYEAAKIHGSSCVESSKGKC